MGRPRSGVQAGSDPGGPQQTILAALSAPQASVRVLALEHVDGLLLDSRQVAPSDSLSASAAPALVQTTSSSQEPSELRAQLQCLVLSSLADDDWAVVNSALSVRQLLQLPKAALFPAMKVRERERERQCV
jgi:hypothetical protein